MTLASIRAKLQLFSAILFVVILAAGALSLVGPHASLGIGAAGAALLILALAVSGGLFLFANRALAPFLRAAETLQAAAARLARGEVCERLAEPCPGELNRLRDSLNSCITGMSGLVEVNQVLQRVAVNEHSTKVTGTYDGL